jgi:tetratricopeptide (TPR) repeat protein
MDNFGELSQNEGVRAHVTTTARLASAAIALAVVSAGLLLPSRAAAQGAVNELLADGWNRYSEELDFEGAAASYQAVTERADATDEQLLEAFEYLAACRFALGDQAGARQALTSLLQINPEQRLSDPSHSPDFLQLLEDVRTEVLDAPPQTFQADDVEAPPSTEQPWAGPAPNPEPPPRPHRPVYRAWWLWTVVGLVVAGAVTTGVVLGTRGGEEEPPQGDLDPGVVQLPCTVRF